MTCRLVVVMWICLQVGLSTGCGAARARAYGALEQLTAAVDPAYSIAVDGCVALEDAVLSLKRAGLRTVDQAKADLVPIRARCDVTREGFERIRLAQLAAKEALDDGDAAAALRQLERARSAWSTLPGGP